MNSRSNVQSEDHVFFIVIALCPKVESVVLTHVIITYHIL